MLVDRWDVLWMQPAMAVGVDDGRLVAFDVVMHVAWMVLMISMYVFARAALPALGLVDGSASPDD